MTNQNCLAGVRCPKCGNGDVFHIGCTTYAVVNDEGAQAYGDLEWDDESRATCAECHLTGPLKEFRTRSDLPPDPEGMNDRRAEWAGAAVAAFHAATATSEEDVLCDLLADLMHWADRAGFDFARALRRAEDHYAAETSACQAADSVACCPTDTDGGTP